MQKRDRNIRERKKHRLSKKNVKSKRIVSITRKEPIVVLALPSIYVRVNLFVPKKKVNLALNTHALQIILFGPIYVRTQYHFGSLQIESLQLAPSVGRACVNLKDFRCNVSDGGSGSTSPRGGTASGGCQPAPGRVKGLLTW